MVKSLLSKKRRSWRSRKLRVWATVGFVILLVHWLFVLVFLLPRLGQLSFFRLHYTAEYGVDWIGNWYYIFTFPALGLVFHLLNGFVSDRLSSQYRLFSEMIVQSTVFLQIAFAAAGVMAVLLNA